MGLQGEVAAMRVSSEALQKERYRLLQIEKGVESDLKQWSMRLEHSLEKKNQIDSAQKEFLKAREELWEKIKGMQTQLLTVEKEVEGEKGRSSEMEKEIFAMGESIQEKQRLVQLKQKEMAEHGARKNVLGRLREEKQGFSAAAKLLLKEGKATPLYEMMEVAGMEAVMRPYAHTLVVKSKEEREGVLAFAVEKDLKDFSLICLEDFPEGLAAHFLGKVSLAKRFEKESLWEGMYIDMKGVLFYQCVGENHPFLREAELKKLEKWLAKSGEELAALEAELLLSKERQKNLQVEKKGLDEAMRKKRDVSR